MTTPEETSAFETLMQRASAELPEATWHGPGDLGRMSVEAMVAHKDEPREVVSAGDVRLSGAGVERHSADLDAIGHVAVLWQKAVTAVGASLEGAKTAAGRLAASVVQRTQLSLNAAPGPGSVVLSVSPKSNPIAEARPAGQSSLFDEPRPLADQASEMLLAPLDEASTVNIDADELAVRIRELGPRVATAVKALAEVLNKEHFDLDASWREPKQPTRRASISAGTSGWLSDFVAGRALDAVEQEMTGVVRTVSDISKWSIETEELGVVPVDASSLDPDVVRATHVGQLLRLLVLVGATERPDGSSRFTYDALSVLGDDGTQP